MTELSLCLFAVALGGVAWGIRSASGASPVGLWMWGWVAVLASALVTYQSVDLAWAPPATHFMGPLLPAFVLAGALRFADRRVPAWLLPAAVALGLVRGGLAAFDRPDLSHGLALALEPATELAAAAVLWRIPDGPAPSLAQRSLPAAFVALAIVDGAAALDGLAGHELGPPMLWAWLTLGPILVGLQIRAASQRTLGQRRRHEREKAEGQQALRTSEERFRLLAERATDLVCEMTPDGRILYANPSFEELLGFAPAEMLGRNALDLVHPEDRPAPEQAVRRAGEGRAVPQTVFRYQHRDGSWRWIEASARGFRSASGEAHVVGVGRDVTERRESERRLRRSRDELEQRVESRTAQLAAAVAELQAEVNARRQAEEDLRESEERYRTVSELTSDLAFALDFDAEGQPSVEWMTQALERISGFSAAELAERGWAALMHPDDRAAVGAELAAIRAGEPREFEARIVCRDGSVRWLHSRVGMVRDDARAGTRIVGASRDVTERKQAEAARDRLEAHVHNVQRLQSLGVLAGGIAHDFNNLLNVILGNSALGLAELPPDAPGRARLERIQSAARHAAGLTEQMLTYAGRASVSLKPLDLGALLDDLLPLLQASIGAGCELDLQLAPRLPVVLADDTQLRQVIVNLVSNACEALEGEPGTVTLRTGRLHADRKTLDGALGAPDAREGEYVLLEVTDGGSGIDPADHARIFEPFFTTKPSGRGLGLAAVLGIVQGHRGVIRVASAPDGGTTFQVLLPVAQPESGTTPRPRSVAQPKPEETILVVDDEEPVREVTGAFLARAGFRVLEAEDGEQAIERLLAHGDAIDLVVLDLSMPGLGGRATLARLREVRRDLPVVIVSGYGAEHAEVVADAASDTRFLRKPFEPEALVACVRAALKPG